MSFLNEDKVAAAQIGFSTRFNEFFSKVNGPEPFWEQLATFIATKNKVEQHNWLGSVPGFKEWLSDRELAKVANHNYQITNKKWSSGLEVDKDDLDDDNLGMYAPKIQQLAQKAAIHRRNLLIDFLVKGFATTTYGAAYDGAAFFATTHAFGSNKATATLDDTGALDAGIQAMLQIVDEDGEPQGISPTHLVVGPKLRAEARKQLIAERNADGSSNTNFGVVQLVISPKLVGTYDDYWFLLDLSQPIKPLILQMRQEIEFEALTQGRDAFMRDKLFFGCDARYNVGYGLPQFAYGSDGST